MKKNHRWASITALGLSIALPFLACAATRQASDKGLVPDKAVDDYMLRFSHQELLATGKQPPIDLAWFRAEIPRIDIPDKSMEEIYYFRWYSFAKHLVRTPRGWVITEFQEDVPWAGKYNTISAAASMHLREARWLHNRDIAEQYATFWSEEDAEPRRYSFPFADSVHEVAKVTGDKELDRKLLPSLVRNYKAWEVSHLKPNGLFWQVDDRDGMEFSAGGSGYRPSINSYMYGEARAIGKIAAECGDTQTANEFQQRAAQLMRNIRSQLWNPEDRFYETRSATGLSGVRELIGYLPWHYGLARATDNAAWLQVSKPQGFLSKYGYTTSERRDVSFLQPNPHECTWNGPVWPYATTQTLVAMANMFAQPGPRPIPRSTFVAGLKLYVKEQHLRLSDGTVIPWIDEDSDPNTGAWLARSILAGQSRPDKQRGSYYNHSGFADVVISGLFGVRATVGDEFMLEPLIDQSWEHFAIEGIPYHDATLTIVFDRDGKHYNMGKGLQVYYDGRLVARRGHVEPIHVKLHPMSNEDRRYKALPGRPIPGWPKTFAWLSPLTCVKFPSIKKQNIHFLDAD